VEFLQELYNKWLVIKPYTDIFSFQAVIATGYLIALLNSLLRALKNKELFSNFITIASVCVNYLLTALLMEYALEYVKHHNSAASAQNVYLGFVIANFFMVLLMYKIHTLFSYKFTELFFKVVKLFVILTIAHFIIWVKFVVLDLQQEFSQLHYVYSFIVLYISLVLSFIMLFPDVLRTKFGCIVTFSLPRERDA
tara:strand:- start:7762 stop:8346 length:585 start_codon:yes stop_codon:yes gene_type:complete